MHRLCLPRQLRDQSHVRCLERRLRQLLLHELLGQRSTMRELVGQRVQRLQTVLQYGLHVLRLVDRASSSAATAASASFAASSLGPATIASSPAPTPTMRTLV